ncbi:OmpA family protein [Acinetobacter sp. BSP-153]|uniref:OmpA family protein n=1 Tax=unclassified Acinetobacter TaxID=196816 RepID=UPI00124C7D28|nr:OmpA family protein [Acinetobacter sp. TUM15064]
MLKHLYKLIIVTSLMTILSGCLSLGHLNYKQARMLKKQGFTLTEEGWTLRLPEKLLFGFDQSDIQAAQKPPLEALSKQLQQYNLNTIKVVGHTDNIGDPAYNQTLSEKRAASVSQIFIETGFKTQNIQSLGRGASQPLVENNSEENRALNRRVNIIIIP